MARQHVNWNTETFNSMTTHAGKQVFYKRGVVQLPFSKQRKEEAELLVGYANESWLLFENLFAPKGTLAVTDVMSSSDVVSVSIVSCKLPHRWEHDRKPMECLLNTN